MSNLVEHARAELALLRRPEDEPDPMQDAIEAHILKMVELFADEGHSGSSAAYAIGILQRLLSFEPLTPLTGAPEEWTEVQPGWLQNKRCSRVFMRGGQAYDIDAVVFREPSGVCYTSADSSRDVTFPYVPRTEYVDVPASA